METEEERRARLEIVAATILLNLAMEMDKERKDGSYRTAHVSPDYRCGKCGRGFVPKPILKSWQLCLSFKLDFLTT